MPSQGYTYTELENQTFHNTVCLHRDSECLYTAIHFRPHTDPTLLSPLPQLSLSLSGCSAGWLTSRAAGLGGGCPVYQSISRLGAQRGGRQAGRQAVSQAVWWRAEGLMRVSERRSPTFPRRLAAGRACGGGVRLFLTTSQVPALIWELFISCQKLAFPCNCRRRWGGAEEGRERERSLASK